MKIKLVSSISSFLILLGLSVMANGQGSGAVLGIPQGDRASIFSTLAVRQADLSGSNTQESSYFGYSVAARGNTIVVGAPGYQSAESGQAGSVYVFVEPATGWVNMLQTAELSPSENAALNGFGYSVAIADDTIFVGAPGTDQVYVFVKPASGWQNMTETAIIQDQSTFSNDGFGNSVAVDSSGATLVVGAVYASPVAVFQGAAYIFEKPLAGWTSTNTPVAELTASDAAAYDTIGNYVAVNGKTIVVGAAFKPTLIYYGAAYVFVEPGSGWTNMTETAKLTASSQLRNAELGTSLSISGNTIVAGAPGPGPVSGNAYVFVEPSGGWKNSTQTAQINAGNQYEDAFGASVSLNGSLLAVGASVANVGSNTAQGAAYLYAKPSTGWTSTSKFNHEFTDKYGIQYDGVGFSVALNRGTLIAGAPFAYNLSDVGYAYVFTF